MKTIVLKWEGTALALMSAEEDTISAQGEQKEGKLAWGGSAGPPLTDWQQVCPAPPALRGGPSSVTSAPNTLWLLVSL